MGSIRPRPSSGSCSSGLFSPSLPTGPRSPTARRRAALLVPPPACTARRG